MGCFNTMCRLQAGLLLLPAFGQGQALLPCSAGTSRSTVTSTAGAASLASSLECSNGDFAVEWDGEVVVARTIHVFEGTSLTITGAAGRGSGIMDGNHETQLISLGGGSTLYLTNMTLANANSSSNGGAIYVGERSRVVLTGSNSFTANSATTLGGAMMVEESSEVTWDSGEAFFMDNLATNAGGAIFVDDGSTISWTGASTFTGNTAVHGGAVLARNASVLWNSSSTMFSRNEASNFGGAIVADVSSELSWDGNTWLLDNEATNYGGAVYVKDLSNVSWGGDTTVSGNSVLVNGGGIMADESSRLSWGGNTVLSNNSAVGWGGAVYVKNSSSISWSGNTTICHNSAQDGGGIMMYDGVTGSWTGETTFEHNTALWTAGALTVHTSSRASWTGTTAFEHNTADRGGAMFVWASEVLWSAGNTTFAHNLAYDDGGALYATLDHRIECSGGRTTFWNNTAAAGDGGALGLYGSMALSSSVVNISGDVTFTNNSAFGNGGGVFSSANTAGQYFEGVTFQYNSAAVGGAVATYGTGNGDEVTPVPASFVGCRFMSNAATETGGGVESAFGQENFVSSHFQDNYADVGGALQLGGKTNVDGCAFVANSASSRGLAIAAVGFVNISDTLFEGNTFFCQAGEFVENKEQEEGDSGRYDTVCFDCPERSECYSCSVQEAAGRPTCSVALDNTVSEEAGVSLETLSMSRGYWRASNSSLIILACYNPEACLGGQTGVDNSCDNGYQGPYCAVCESGYASSLAHTCTQCSSSRRNGFVVAAAIAVVAAVCAIVAICAHLISGEVSEQSCLHRRLSAMLPLQSFKIIIVVWQILTQFASAANISFPDVYQDFINALDVVNFDLGSLVASGCWADINVDFHDRLLVSTLGPLLVVGGLASTYAVAQRRNSSASGGSQAGVEAIRHKHLSAFLLVTFLVYSSVSATVFQMFACDKLDDGHTYLRADYRILCTSAKHEALQVYAAFMIALYPVGIPLLYAYLLHHRRDVLMDPTADKASAQSTADLWEPYRPERFYYEVIECGRRVLLTGVVVFIYPNTAAQVAVTILIAFFFLMVYEMLAPYRSDSDMWLSRGGHVIVFLSMFDVLLLKVDVSDERTESQRVFAGVIVAGHCLMFLAVIVEAVGVCYASSKGQPVSEHSVPSRRTFGPAAQRSRSTRALETAEDEECLPAEAPLGSWKSFVGLDAALEES
ncbi:unnamed protein product [Ectocarpus sp. CCAP 1310/34]|nr:unnamed protein product [Ectocarpus sp. CCAP 1310/34]